jgi:hypothetical protein
MICSSLNLLVLMSIILRVDGLLGNLAGTVYGGQVSKSMKTRDFLMINEPRYLTAPLVIPQNCGIYQS